MTDSVKGWFTQPVILPALVKGFRMLVLWEARLVLLATPKTGSSALSAALAPEAALAVLKPPLLKHTTVHRYHRFIAPYLLAATGETFSVCALIRAPRDWLGSWFRYRARPGAADTPNSTAGMDFDAFVRAWCATPQPGFAAVGSQARFLAPRQGQGVDHLFRYEDMDRFLDFLQGRMGRRLLLPRVNVSPAAPLALSPEAEALLHRHAARDAALHAAADGNAPRPV